MSVIKTWLIVTLAITLPAASGVPVENMSSDMLDIEYSGNFSGQTIKKSEVSSRFQTHYFMLRYAPVPSLLISGGIGSSVFETDAPFKFKGDPGFSPTAAVHLFSPKLFTYASLTSGISASLINSKNVNDKYITLFFAPEAGILLYIGTIFDLTVGAKGHILSGTTNSSSFSNNNYVRGFLSMTLHSLQGRSYATMTVDLSPQSSKDWSFGPNEASIGFQIGYFLKPLSKKESGTSSQDTSGYFHDFNKMKQLQEKMADDLKERE